MSSIILKVNVNPGSSRDEILGFREDVLRVRVTSPPRDGEANKSFIRLLSKRLKVPKSNIKIVKGERSRDKLVELVDTRFNNIDEIKEFLHRESSE